MDDYIKDLLNNTEGDAEKPAEPAETARAGEPDADRPEAEKAVPDAESTREAAE